MDEEGQKRVCSDYEECLLDQVGGKGAPKGDVHVNNHAPIPTAIHQQARMNGLVIKTLRDVDIHKYSEICSGADLPDALGLSP